MQTWQDAYPNLSLDAITRPPDQDEYQILHYRLTDPSPPSSFFRIRIEKWVGLEGRVTTSP